MQRVNRKKVNKATDFEFEGKVYVTIPEVVADSNLPATSKLVFGIINGFKREWNSVSTKYIAEVLGLSVRTIQHAITFLEDAKLIEYYYRGKKRFFKSLIKDTDAKVIVPSDILGRTDIASTYKISYGYLVAAGMNDLGAYNFVEISELAMHLGISISSVYRHLGVLLELEVVERDANSKWMFYTLDSYSVNYRKNKAKELKRLEKDKTDVEMLTPKEHEMLERIYNRL